MTTLSSTIRAALIKLLRTDPSIWAPEDVELVRRVLGPEMYRTIMDELNEKDREIDRLGSELSAIDATIEALSKVAPRSKHDGSAGREYHRKQKEPET